MSEKWFSQGAQTGGMILQTRAKKGKVFRMAEIIKIENLTKKFGDVTALENVNLSIGRGKIYGIVGRKDRRT